MHTPGETQDGGDITRINNYLFAMIRMQINVAAVSSAVKSFPTISRFHLILRQSVDIWK